MNPSANTGIHVIDVDQAFPTLVEAPSGGSSADAQDVGLQVNSALRKLLGWRPRVEDPKAFVDALTASFTLVQVEGHVEAQFVPRGYAVQSDLGAVTGGQASLYRRAMIARTEMVRILNGLTPLRVDADPQDMEAYRSLVSDAVQRLVDEFGTAGGPRAEVVDSYFRALTGTIAPQPGVTADTVSGQLAALRNRFGLLDQYVNTVEEEGIRTSFWTLVDLIVDLQNSWHAQRRLFVGAVGQGFLGTELILLSRLMEAASDQVDEFAAVLDSVSVPQSERRTLIIREETQLTLDGLMLWLHTFLTDEARRIAQDSGRDGIVSALAPTAADLFAAFQRFANRLIEHTYIDGDGNEQIATYLPTSCNAPLPAGLYAARSRIAIGSTCRLLRDLTNTACRIGRYPRPVFTHVIVYPMDLRLRKTSSRAVQPAQVVAVEFVGVNLRSTFEPRLLAKPAPLDKITEDDLIVPRRASVTGDDERLVGVFDVNDNLKAAFNLAEPSYLDSGDGFSVPAEDVAFAVFDTELGALVLAPEPHSWPNGKGTSNPTPPAISKRH